MNMIEVFFYPFGTIFFFSALIFAYYAFKNARLMRGALGHRFMAVGGGLFMAATIVGALDHFSFPGSGLVYAEYFIWVIGLSAIVAGGMLRARVMQQAHRISLFRIFTMTPYTKIYLMGIAVLLLISLPISTISVLSPLIAEPGWFDAGNMILWAFAFAIMAVAERKLHFAVRKLSLSSPSSSIDEEMLLRVREDILALRAYSDLISRLSVTAISITGVKTLRDILSKCADEHDILKDCEMTDEGTLMVERAVENLTTISEKEGIPKVFDGFSSLISRFINFYSAVTSPEFGKEMLAKNYQATKEIYGDKPIFLGILRTMPEGFLEEEKLVLLNREELEAKVKERTKELEEALINLQKTIVSWDYVDNILRSMSDTLIVVSSNGNIQTVNPAACTLLGYEEKELVGQPIGKIWVGEELQSKRAEKVPKMHEAQMRIEDLIKKGSIQNMETTYLKKDSRKIPVLFSGSVMRDDKGKIQGIVCVAQNITERNRAEEALAEERNLLRTLIDNLPDSIYIKDTESRFVIGNIEVMRRLGVATLEEFIGKTDFDFFPQELAAQYYADEQEIIRSGQPLVNREELVIDKAGNKRWNLTTKVPLRDSLGKIVGLVGIGRNITDLKTTYTLLEEKNKELESFVYTISHDLKAPLVSLEGFASILIDKYKESLDEIGQLYLSRIQANVKKMGDLIQDLLELSRIGRVVNPYESVNTEKIVREAIETLQLQLLERGTEWVIQEDLPTIHCDRVRIKQVFLNLIDNANKFMGEENNKPRIEIGFHAESPDADGDKGDFFEFFVKDNGIGINKEYHEKVFEIFTRLGDVDVEGTGVGLTIAKKIVETHGGKIWLDSDVGEGTTVYFTLPKSLSR